MKQKLLIILLLLSAFSYAQDYTYELNEKQKFDEFSGPPLVSKYGNVTAVKVVYDLRKKQVYYINSNKYNNHYEFCYSVLKYPHGLGNFNKQNYSTKKNRRFLLANINYFQNDNKYVIDISPVDLMNTDQIKTIYNLIKQTSYCGDNLFFMLNSPRLEEISKEFEIPTIKPSDVYKNLTYQPISKFANIGKLRIISDIRAETIPIQPTDIVILKNIPNYIPICAGLIVTEFQTPLSHVSLLGLNRKIPICAHTNIFELDSILKYEGQQVSLVVKADTFYISTNLTIEVEKHSKKFKLKKDLSVQEIQPVEKLNLRSSKYVGSKAANFGKLYKISKKAPFDVPENAFAIPFFFYEEHMVNSNAQKLIDELITNPEIQGWELEAKLYAIQGFIMNSHVNQALVDSVESYMQRNTKYTTYRFRSSTNAEDIKGFSGAGLYTSTSAKIGSKKKTVELAIKTVWASLWSPKAYRERQYYGISQKDISMGILIHRSFPKESVNGVAITKNIYRKNSYGFLVNAQAGNVNVVNPPQGVTCEQFICFPNGVNTVFEGKHVIDIITYSNLSEDKLLMSQEEIKLLANVLEIIKRHYYGSEIDTWEYLRIGLDIEFKLDGINRTLYIKQVREFND
jgi:hypothetical protein